MIRLTQLPGAQSKPPRTTGLFHVAIRLPDRRALARLIQRLIDHEVSFQGASDHKVSEAFYLADPDGIGLELYVDRPRDHWPMMNDQVAMGTDPLDIFDLLRQAEGNGTTWIGIDPDTDIGHVHLQVSDLSQTESFYHDLLGFDVTQRNYPGALFFAAGGYHHHIGANVWASRNASPPPANSVGLISYAISIPETPTWEALLEGIKQANIPLEDYTDSYPAGSFMVRDPSGNAVELLTSF